MSQILGHTKVIRAYVAVILAIVVLALPIPSLVIAGIHVALLLGGMRPRGREYGLVLIVAGLFFTLDNMAISAGFFAYHQQDIWNVPYWAPLAWPIWILHAYRVLPNDQTRVFSRRLLLLMVLFSCGFIYPMPPLIVFCITFTALVISLMVFHARNDLIYVGYFAFMGIIVETVGLSFSLWMYPERDLVVSIANFIVMWAGVGLYSRAIAPKFLMPKS